MKRLALLALVALALSGCSYELQHNLNEEDANDIYTLLSKNGISSKKMKEEGGNEPTYQIIVAKADAAQATELLREHSLPRPQHPGWEGISKSKGMIPTEMEQRAMMLQALQGEVERGLQKVDGILEVTAIPMQPENNDLTQPDKKPANSASVLVKYRPTPENKPPLDEQKIREWVASALPDTRPENVRVLLSEAHGVTSEFTPGMKMVTVLGGMQMTEASRQQFLYIVGIMAIVAILSIGINIIFMMRGSGSQSSQRRARPTTTS